MNSVYVLTVPAFIWIDVTSSQNNNTYGRHQNSCVMWNEAQMISFGGTIGNSSADFNLNGCNPSTPPLLVLDTSTFLFKEQFSPDQVYGQPEAVFNKIGGTALGQSPAKGPPGGFNDTRLSSIFSKTVARVTAPTTFAAEASTYTTSTSSLSTTSSSASTSTTSSGISHSSPKAGVIAGSVVGSVAGLLLILGVIIFFLRHRKGASAQATVVSYTGKPELSGQSAPGIKTAAPPHAEMGENTTYEVPGGETHWELPGHNVQPYELGEGR